MTTRIWTALVATAVLTTGVCIDLDRQAHAGHKRSDPTAALARATRTFTDPASGIAVAYPANWHAVPTRTAELAVAAPTGHASLQLDVPAMSWHPPFIPIGLVTSRYVDAYRQQQAADAVTGETTDLTVAGATARRVTARGHSGGAVCVDTAVVIVHRGQVYILSCDSDDAGATLARHALDAATASVRWAK